MSRYDSLFAALDAKNEGAFVPFVTLGDPNEEASYRIIKALIEGGADALELGVPFSDPVADGPTIQAAHIRAHASGIDVDAALRVVRRIRDEHADIPIGLLIYGNVAFARGTEQFYRDVAQAGADSVLLPDIPVREGESFAQAATAAGVDPIFIAPPHANPSTLEGVARLSRGYIYAVSRVGVTGAEKESSTEGLSDVVANLNSFGGAPALLGFGISTPAHIADAIAAGAAGAITGSAVTAIVAKHCEQQEDGQWAIKNDGALHDDIVAYVQQMKAATART